MDEADTYSPQAELSRLWTWVGIALVGWTVVLATSLYWSVHNSEQDVFELAHKEARANLNKDQAIRAWASTHRSIYVPVDEDTQPSPWLEHIDEQNIATPSGTRLTLLNPNSVLRGIMSYYDDLYGVKGRIVSPEPLNPENAPDPWEAKTLAKFSGGSDEVAEITPIGSEPYLRVLRPMIAADSCSTCHDSANFRSGFISGGIGVSVPMKPYLAVHERRRANLIGTHGFIWLLGVGAILWGATSARSSIWQRRRFQTEIWNQANYDQLTGLASRNLFLDRLEQSMHRATRSRRKVVLMFIDLDRFKHVNDTQGHAVGDILLREAAERIRHCVRQADTVSRIGGDEFTVILNDIEDPLDAAILAERIITSLEQTFYTDSAQLHVSASIGITVFPDDGSDANTLLKNSDTAMYKAKDDGRDTYRFFTPEMADQALVRMRTENELRAALHDDNLLLLFQPIVNARDREISSMEALLRLKRPGNELVSPDSFIEIAEESGLIIPIGEWVLERVASMLNHWQADGRKLIHVTVNVSPVQCKHKRFLPFIDHVLDKYGHWIADYLIMEITENLYISGEESVVDLIQELRYRNIRLSIDDFGTGYSSLSYLKQFHVDTLKIDRSFIRDISSDPDDRALCEAIIAMSHRLGLTVVGEGVETEEQLRFLNQHQCDLAQGFLFSRPISEQEILEYMNTPVPRYAANPL